METKVLCRYGSIELLMINDVSVLFVNNELYKINLTKEEMEYYIRRGKKDIKGDDN